MMLNKKYTHKKKTPQIPQLTPKNKRYPIRIPSYSKLSHQQWESLVLQDFWVKYLQYFAGESYSPLLISNIDHSCYKEALRGKEKLPFFAKKQRLATTKTKQLKKTDQLLQAFFSRGPIIAKSFSAADQQKMQEICSLLSSKSLFSHQEQLVYRDTVYQTPVHSSQIEWREEQENQLHIKCFVEAKSEALTLVVDDLLTFFSDLAVLVHINDKRYKKYLDKNIIIPIINKTIPIIGVTEIDTVKNNGIQRINPLISSAYFEKAKEIGLPLTYNAIDEEGRLNGDFGAFSGASILEKKENLIETLEVIGNLAEKFSQTVLVPYSKLSGTRLIKKIVPGLVIDFSSVQSDFFSWVESTYPQVATAVLERGAVPIACQVNNLFCQSFAYQGGQVRYNSASLLANQGYSPVQFFLLALILQGSLESGVSINDLIDICYLTPQEDREMLAEAFGERKTFLQEVDKIKSLSADQWIEIFLKEFASIEGISLSKDQLYFSFDTNKLFSDFKLKLGAWDDQVLRMMKLSTLAKELNAPITFFTPYEMEGLTLLFLLEFLSGEAGNYCFIETFPLVQTQGNRSEKLDSYAQKYGRDAISLLLAQQKKPEEGSLEDAYSYLNHLWNLFKFLYENQGFEQDNGMRMNAVDIWIFGQYVELKAEYSRIQKSITTLPHFLEKMQHFTRKHFSWYLEYLKKEKNPDYHMAGVMFLLILDLLHIVVPGLYAEILQIIGTPPTKDVVLDVGLEKDFKIHKLFDLIKKIGEVKADFHLKKHQSIVLIVKCDENMCGILDQNRAVLQSLLAVEQIEFVNNFKTQPLIGKIIVFGDIEFGIKDTSSVQEQDELALLEQKYASYARNLQMVRDTLVMLTSSPLADQEKIEEREDELSQIKDQMMILEIKIQKLKMKKKM